MLVASSSSVMVSSLVRSSRDRGDDVAAGDASLGLLEVVAAQVPNRNLARGELLRARSSSATRAPERSATFIWAFIERPS